MFITLNNGHRLNAEHVVFIFSDGRVQLSNGFECQLHPDEIGRIEEIVGMYVPSTDPKELLEQLRLRNITNKECKGLGDPSIPVQARRGKRR